MRTGLLGALGMAALLAGADHPMLPRERIQPRRPPTPTEAKELETRQARRHRERMARKAQRKKHT